MATTTTNYGFDIPQSTDLVKDGATAIATLGQDIDTAMNTALGTKKAGMVLLNTTSFSGVASQAINNVFTTTYDNYLIVIGELIGSTTATCQFKLRVGGVDNSTSYYWGLSMTNSLAAAVLSGGSNTDHFRIGNLVNAVRGFATFSVNAPFLTKETLFAGSLFNEFGGSLAGGGSGGLHATATSFDGFNIIASTGTVTGKVSVYGYNK